MLYYDRIFVSGGIGVNKTNESKECSIRKSEIINLMQNQKKWKKWTKKSGTLDKNRYSDYKVWYYWNWRNKFHRYESPIF